MQLDYVQDYLDEQMNKLHAKNIASAAEVLEAWSSVLRGERKEPNILPNSTIVYLPPTNHEIIAAGKEIMKRWPDSMVKAKIENIKASTKLTNAKADALTTQDANVDDTVSDLLNKVRAKESDDK